MLLLVKVFNLKTTVDENFQDVKNTDYYYEALGIAKKLGIAKGTGNNTFNPKTEISRQDMMVLVARAMNVAEKPLESASASELDNYIDVDQISSYAINDVAKLIKAGIIKGMGNFINPKGMATRAETAVIIYRIYNEWVN